MGFNEYMTALYQRKLLLWESTPNKAALYEARQGAAHFAQTKQRFC